MLSTNDDQKNDCESLGASNCSWTSCREGCTKELYDCKQIRVNYKLPLNTTEEELLEEGRVGGGVEDDENALKPRYERALKDYDYVEDFEIFTDDEDDGLPKPFPTGIMVIPRNRYLSIKFHIFSSINFIQ